MSSSKMQGFKKLPLFIGLLLITFWGAPKKINLQTNNASCMPLTSTQLLSYADKLKQLSCLTTKNWDVFYDTASPLLPAIVSDEELHFVYLWQEYNIE